MSICNNRVDASCIRKIARDGVNLTAGMWPNFVVSNEVEMTLLLKETMMMMVINATFDLYKKRLRPSKTCPCNILPKPHFYTEKLGFAGLILILLCLIQIIHCGYSTRVPTMYVLS